MTINIIYTPNPDPYKDRWQSLSQELASQNITDFRIWPGIIDKIMPFRGVSKAHKQIVKWAKETGLDQIMIAEDDIKFTCQRSFQYFLDNKPIDFDLYLSSVYHGKIESDNTITEFCGLTLYIIHSRFYNDFLKITEQNHLDMSLKNTGKFVVCNPFIAVQRNGWSLQKNLHKVYDETSAYMQNRPILTS